MHKKHVRLVMAQAGMIVAINMGTQCLVMRVMALGTKLVWYNKDNVSWAGGGGLKWVKAV